MTDTARRWLQHVPVWVLPAFVAAAAVVAAAFGWDWLRGGPEPFESGGATLHNLALILVAIVGLLFAWRRNRTINRQAEKASRQAETANEQAETANRQAETAARDLRNERYQKGADMLGNATLAMRLGGVYALEQLAREHPEEYHVPIVELLCAFIRPPAEDGRPESVGADGGEPDDSTHGPDRRRAPDTEAAAQAIGRRRVEKDRCEFVLNLRGANLSGANLEDANLDGVHLEYANLEGAKLRGAHLENAHLEDANLRGAHLEDAHLEDANLRGANLEGANLSSANLSRANLEGAHLEGTILWGAILWGAYLEDADLSGADLSGVVRSSAHLEGANLSRANLEGAKLSRTHLEYAKLWGANLSGANLWGAHLEDAKLLGASLRGAILSGANLEGVKGLTQSGLDEAFIWKWEDPPWLGGALDAVTGEPLVWRGEVRTPLEDEAGD